MSPRKRGSLPFILARRHRLAPAAYPFRLLSHLRIHAGSMMRVNAFQENVCPDRNIFGLATHKVYPLAVSPRPAVGSYPTFSPLPRLSRGGYFLWHLLCNPRASGDLFPVRKYGALCCPDFPPPPCDGSGRADCQPVAKIQQKCQSLAGPDRPNI
jgi:hypothetical protein